MRVLFLLIISIFAFGFDVRVGWNLLGSLEDTNSSDLSSASKIYTFVNGKWQKNPKLIKKAQGYWAYIDSLWYKPKVGVSWQWQLSGKVNEEYSVKIYDIDLFDSSSDLINRLKK